MHEVKEAVAEKRSYKKIKAMHISKAANGGHIVAHHYHSNGEVWQQPKEHAFGKEDGENGTTHAHVMEHLGKMGIHPSGAAPAEEEA